MKWYVHSVKVNEQCLIANIKVTHRLHLCNKCVVPEHIEESSTSQDFSSTVREALKEASNTAHTKAVQHNFIAKRFTSPDSLRYY